MSGRDAEPAAAVRRSRRAQARPPSCTHPPTTRTHPCRHHHAPNRLQELAALDDLEAHDAGDEPSPEEAAAEAERQADCMRCVVDLLLSTLGKRERNVLRLRYGLLPAPAALPPGAASAAGAAAEADATESAGAMSLGEVAVAYGLSRERIRQIEDKAMRVRAAAAAAAAAVL